jgi:GntR family transcriptional regulator
VKVPGVPAETPKYLRVTEQLEDQMRRLPPNSLLATEQQLAKRFLVSRITIRRALSVLERSGRVSRIRGRGTIVSAPKIVRRIVPARTIDSDFRDQGIKLETRILLYEPRATPTGEARARLMLGSRATVGHLVMARLVDDQIICHDRRYLPATLASRFNPVLAEREPVSDILQQLAGGRIVGADLEMEISAADADVARCLGVVPGMLIAINMFTEYLETQVPLECGVMSYRIDRVKFQVVQRESARRGRQSSGQVVGRNRRSRPAEPSAVHGS